MRAITLLPGTPDSARLEEVPDPGPEEGSVLVDGVALGICGTDNEIVGGEYGEAPPGAERLVLGHESLGRVIEAPAGSGLEPGDLVVGIVRRPDPEPCPSCAAGEWDFCRNGGYTERGIKALHGYGSERWRIEPEFAVKLDPALGLLGVLMEPTSVVAKAWEQIDRILERATIGPRRVLVTGAGPIGLLAALLTAQRGYELHVLDRATEGPKPELVEALGGTYHHDGVAAVEPKPDIIIEATGAGVVVLDALWHTAENGIVCLTGVSAGGHRVPLRPRAPQPRARAPERPRLRHGQREPPPLRRGGRGARARGPRLARAPDHAACPARRLGVGAPARRARHQGRRRAIARRRRSPPATRPARRRPRRGSAAGGPGPAPGRAGRP